jgi:hypothetical protein
MAAVFLVPRVQTFRVDRGDVVTHAIEACVLCGSETRDRAMSTVEWIEPIGNERWSWIPRCVDRPACRETVELALGEPWPVNDRTPIPTRPMPVVEPAPAVVAPIEEEVIPWLK